MGGCSGSPLLFSPNVFDNQLEKSKRPGRNSLRIPTLLALLVLTWLSAACSPGGWREVRSLEGGFSVEMPGKPEIQTQARATIFGVIRPVVYLVDHPEAQYLLNYADYPPGLVGESTPDVILDGAVLGLVSDTGGSLQAVEAIELQGYPGREVHVTAPDGRSEIRARIYLVGERLYQLLVLASVEVDVAADTARYFDSLSLFAYPPAATEVGG